MWHSLLASAGTECMWHLQVAAPPHKMKINEAKHSSHFGLIPKPKFTWEVWFFMVVFKWKHPVLLIFFQYPRFIVNYPKAYRWQCKSKDSNYKRPQEHQDASKLYQDESLSITFIFIYLFLDRFSLCSAGWYRANYAELASNLETPPASALRGFS